MISRKGVPDAKRFFRNEAHNGWGYLVRGKTKEKPAVLDDRIQRAREVYGEALDRARQVCRSGIRDAWAIYTKDNPLEREARKALGIAIHKASEDHDNDWSSKSATKIYRAVRKAHEQYADNVLDLWKTFKEDLERIPNSRGRPKIS